MPVLSKFQGVTAQGDSVNPSALAESLSNLGLHVRQHLPAGATVTLIPQYSRIVVKVDAAELLAGTTIDGFVDVRTPEGKWRQGTKILQRYDADEYYGNILNLREATQYEVRVTLRLRNSADVMVREFVESWQTTTLSSAAPQEATRYVYVDTVDGNNSNTGLAPTLAKKWFDGIAAIVQPGDTIRVVEGNFVGAAASSELRLRGVNGTATNWIKIEPCPAELLPVGKDPTIRRARALDGTWTDQGGGVFSMSITTATSATLANVWDSTIEEHLYPFMDSAGGEKNPFVTGDADSIGDGTGYWVAGTTASSTDTLYVRLASDANPGTGRLIGAFGSGLAIQSSTYIAVENMSFAHCGLRTKSASSANGSLSSAGIQVDDVTSATPCEHIIIRGGSFTSNATDVSLLDVTGAGVNDVLIEDNEFLFDGPWDHFMGQYDYTEADPYVQTSSWSHIKSSAWELWTIYANGHANIVSRNNYSRGKQYLNGAAGDTTNMVHFHSEGDVIEECWDDAIGDFEGTGAFMNAVVLDCTVREATVMISLAPVNAGPFWLLNSICDGYVHYPFKIGSQSSSTSGHGYKIIANVSCRAKGFSDDWRDGMNYILNGSSGIEATNLIIRGVQNGTSVNEVYFTQLGGASSGNVYTVEADRTNVWRNCLFFMENRDTPLAPEAVQWRNAGGATTDYATFADATSAIGSTDTAWVDVVGAYSNNGDADPFPTSIATGLNASITTSSIPVRGVTTLASVPDAGLPLGAFTMRAAE